MTAPPLPLVGDTLWLRQRVAAEGAEVRAPAWTPGGDLELLDAPTLRQVGDSVEIAWPLVAWRPGPHPVTVPGALRLHADGRVDTLPAWSETLSVRSILPGPPGDTTLAPQPAAGIVPRPVTSPVPVAVTLGAAVLLLLPLHWWWRARRRARPAAMPPAVAPPAPERWLESGEPQAALELARGALDTVPTGAATEAPRDASLGEALAAARYAPPEAEAVAALLARLRAGRGARP